MLIRWKCKYITDLKSIAVYVFLSAVGYTWAQSDYQIYDRPPFQYYYAGRDEALLGRLDNALQDRLREMEGLLEARLLGTLRVELPLTRGEFNRLTQGRAPHWSGGMAFPQQMQVVLKTPAFIDGEAPMDAMAAHEVAHILLHQATKGHQLPRWFEEGLCQVLAGETRLHSLSRLGRAAAADRLMGLPRVDNVLSFSSSDADLAYAEARAAVITFIDHFDWTTVRTVIASIAAGQEFADAFKAATGFEYDYWQADWLENAQKKYKNIVLLDIENYIWIGIALLSLTAIGAVFIRNRRQLKKWMKEEEEDEGPPEPSNEPIHP